MTDGEIKKAAQGAVGPDSGDILGQGPGEAEFDIGFDSPDPKVMLIQIPVEAWANDRRHGVALVIGHLKEAQDMAMKVIREKRMKKAQGGLIRPAGPISPPGKA